MTSADPPAALRPLAELAALRAAEPELVVVDVRERDERARRPLEGSVHLPLSTLEALSSEALAEALPSLEARVAVVCARGERSLRAAAWLRARGYGRADGDWEGVDAARERAAADAHPRLTLPEERARFARHLDLAEIGPEGQARLLGARALVVGAGGLGCPASLYLAAAGVGALTLVDPDHVELSNLQRQILHGVDVLGAPKVESAARALRRLDARLAVDARAVRADADNALALVEGHDVVVDGTDALEARYALSDACARLGVPLVHASVHRFEGQLTVFDPARGGPCYRCMHPNEPPRGLFPSCAAGGVLGVLPGLLGVLQATEALKLLLGLGAPLRGRLLLVDALGARFREIALPARAGCACEAWRPR